MTTLYNILGIKEVATPEQIRDAYRVMAMKWHPDRNPNNRLEAEAKFKEIGAAYKILSNPKSRRDYDKWLSSQRQNTSQSSYIKADGISEDDAEKTFFESMLDIALELARRGYQLVNIVNALTALNCPQDIATKVAEIAINRINNLAPNHENVSAREVEPTYFKFDDYHAGIFSKSTWLVLALTLIGLFDVPYAYFTFLHFAFFLVASYGAYLIGKNRTSLTFMLVLVAFFYNPITHITLGRDSRPVWIFLNFITVLILFYVRRRCCSSAEIVTKSAELEEEYRKRIDLRQEELKATIADIKATTYPLSKFRGWKMIAIWVLICEAFLALIIIASRVAVDGQLIKVASILFGVAGVIIGSLFYRSPQERENRSTIREIETELRELEAKKITLVRQMVALIVLTIIVALGGVVFAESKIDTHWQYPTEQIVGIGLLSGLAISIISFVMAMFYRFYIKASNRSYAEVRESLPLAYKNIAVLLGAALVIAYFIEVKNRELTYKQQVEYQVQQQAQAQAQARELAHIRMNEENRGAQALTEEKRLDEVITELELRYPELDEKSPQYSQKITDEVLARQKAYIRQGQLPSTALQSAVADMVRTPIQ